MASGFFSRLARDTGQVSRAYSAKVRGSGPSEFLGKWDDAKPLILAGSLCGCATFVDATPFSFSEAALT
jgi:hypothetical protein